MNTTRHIHGTYGYQGPSGADALGEDFRRVMRRRAIRQQLLAASTVYDLAVRLRDAGFTQEGFERVLALWHVEETPHGLAFTSRLTGTRHTPRPPTTPSGG